jgi:hypothetical protein
MVRKSGNRFSEETMLNLKELERFAAGWIPVRRQKGHQNNGEETATCNRGPHRNAKILLFWLTIRRQYA